MNEIIVALIVGGLSLAGTLGGVTLHTGNQRHL